MRFPFAHAHAIKIHQLVVVMDRKYRVSQKVAPGDFFADYSETTWNFEIKYYTFMQRFHICD